MTINRPEARNAVSPEVHQRMIAVWADFAEDDSRRRRDPHRRRRRGLLRRRRPEGVHPADHARRRTRATSARSSSSGSNGFTRGMHRIYKPIIGAINGWALAGGFETALACDIRIASEHAMFGSFEARRGFHHGDGGLVRLVNAGGVGVAMHMLLTAEPIDAHQAMEWNLVSKVVPHEQLMEEAETVARQILRNSQRAVRSAKQTILDVVGQPTRPAAPDRGLERLHLRRPRGDAGDARALLREDRRRARRRRTRPSSSPRRPRSRGARRRACGGRARRAAGVSSSSRSSSSPERSRFASSRLPPRGERIGRRLGSRRAARANSARSSRSGASPARSSRATTAQTLAATSTLKRCSRGTSGRSSANRYSATASSSSAASGGPASRRRSDQLQHVPLRLADAAAERGELVAAADARSGGRAAWRAQITAHLTLPNTSQ